MVGVSVVVLSHVAAQLALDCGLARPLALNGTSVEPEVDCEALLEHWRAWSPLAPLLSLSLLVCFSPALKLGLLLLLALTPPFSSSKLVLIFGALFTHARDRHLERVARAHFLWKSKLKVEQNDVEVSQSRALKPFNSAAIGQVTGGINKILLENILPQHVAQHFLLARVRGQLYHEQ